MSRDTVLPLTEVPHNLASLVAMEMGYTVKEPRVTEIKRRLVAMAM